LFSPVSSLQSPVSGNAESWLAGDPNTIATSQGEKKPTVMRVRVAYSRHGEACFLGVKEMATLFGRATRRAHLPMAYSQGFHPLPRFSFGPALPVGIESEEEFLDLELSEVLTAAEVKKRLGPQLPRGFSVYWAEAIDLRAPSIDESIEAYRYLVALDSLPEAKRAPAMLAAHLSTFATATTFPMQKSTRHGEKTVDAKLLIAHVALTAPLQLSLETIKTRAGTLKPHEFVGTLLSLTPEETKVLRVRKLQTIFRSSPTPDTDRKDTGSEEEQNLPLETAVD
jgi:radical SAM-linked protein